MSSCEHFFHGHIKGYGSTVRQSSGVDEILSPSNWRYLVMLGGNLEAEVKKLGTDHLEVRTILWDDKLVAYSFLKPTRDEAYGRSGTFNHTILVPILWYIDGSNIGTKIPALFWRNLEQPPKNPLSKLVIEV
jgi:hypothetical protein